MISRADLVSAKEELLNGKGTIQNCEKLAAVCTVLDHVYERPQEPQYSGADVSRETYSIIQTDNSTQFLSELNGRDMAEVLPLIDELVATVQVLHPRLYAGFMRKLTDR